MKDNCRDRDGHLLVERAGGQERRGASRRTSRPRSSSSPPRRSPRSRAASPTPSACSSGTTRPPTRRATAAPTSGSPTSSASGSRSCTPSSTLPRDQGFQNLTWDYDPTRAEREWRIKDEPTRRKILKEINGYQTATGDAPDRLRRPEGRRLDHLRLLDLLRRLPRAGPEPRGQQAARSARTTRRCSLGWGFAWPANRRIIYNRASADPDGQPWSERKKWVWWDGAASGPATTCPDFAADQGAERARPNPNGDRAGRAVGHRSVHHEGRRQGLAVRADRPGRRPAADALRAGRVAGARTRSIKQQIEPGAQVLEARRATRWPPSAIRSSRTSITTYRLTEHHLSRRDEPLAALADRAAAGAVRRDQPGAGRARRASRTSTGSRSSTPRGAIRAKALVTRRMRPFTIDGQTIHHVGMPWHWGYKGLVDRRHRQRPDGAGGRPERVDPRGKAFVCNVEKLRGAPTLQARRRHPASDPRGGDLASRWASSPTRPSASAARRARWPARSGTSCRPRNGGVEHAQRRQLRQHARVSTASTGGTSSSSSSSPQTAQDGRWLMMSDVCKHCVQAGCLEVCPTGAIIRTEFDTVVIQSDACNGCRDCIAACPFGVIDINPVSSTAQKCTLCYDRLQVGLSRRAPRRARPTSIQFGPIAELQRARRGAAWSSCSRPGESRAPISTAPTRSMLGGLNSFYLLVDKPEVYGLPPDPQVPSRNLKGPGSLCSVLGALALTVDRASSTSAERGSRPGAPRRTRQRITLSSTFFTASPDWGWLIVALLLLRRPRGRQLFPGRADRSASARREDRPLARLGYLRRVSVVCLVRALR